MDSIFDLRFFFHGDLSPQKPYGLLGTGNGDGGGWGWGGGEGGGGVGGGTCE